MPSSDHTVTDGLELCILPSPLRPRAALSKPQHPCPVGPRTLMDTLAYLPTVLSYFKKNYKILVKLASVTHQQAWPMGTLKASLQPTSPPVRFNVLGLAEFAVLMNCNNVTIK